jgi:glycosyltransferase involved in cell wall biosynthesis
LAALFRGQGLDILHTNDTGCDEAPLAARRARVPKIIGTFHVLPSVDLGGTRDRAIHRRLERQSSRALDTAIAVSDAARAAWVARTAMSPERMLTIHNGINLDRFCRHAPAGPARVALGIPDDGALVVGAMGRLDPVKGFEYLVDAAALLRAAGRRLRVVFAGDGPSRGMLEERARQTGAHESVHFLGFRKDVQAVLDAFDVFVLSSLTEALPYALMEAMAAELPCIGTDVGGVPELIVPGSTGLLVPPRDISALATAIGRLLDAPRLRQDMGRAGRERVNRHFSEQEMVRRTVRLYEEAGS